MANVSPCSDFEIEGGDPDTWSPCHCPKCGAYLPRDFPLGEQFVCKKCGTVLETIPRKLDDLEDPDEYIKPSKGEEYLYGGRICIVPAYAVEIDATLPPKVKKPVKRKTNLWALCREGFRRVFEDQDGKRFIELYEKATDSFEKVKVELTDARILKLIEDPKKDTLLKHLSREDADPTKPDRLMIHTLLEKPKKVST